MACNFWRSSHCLRWILREKKEPFQPIDRNYFKPTEIKWLRLYFVEILHKAGKYLKFRQKLVATAAVFFKRFYIQQSFVNFDPFLVVPTLLFIAAKTEEWPCRPEKILAAVEKYLKADCPSLEYGYGVPDLIQCEFYAIEVLEFDLIVFHPYRSLLIILAETKIVPDAMDDRNFPLQDEEARKFFDLCWSIVNDSLRTDLSLFHPPYLIAATAVYIAAHFLNKMPLIRVMLENLAQKLSQVIDITNEILSLYEFYDKGSSVDMGALLLKLFNKIRDPQVHAFVNAQIFSHSKSS